MPNRRFKFQAPPPASTGCDQEECLCCAALRQARADSLWDPAPELNSPLTPGIAIGNLAATEGGASLRVDLWREWPRLLADLRRVGSVLWMTRHPAAAIGKWGTYPALAWQTGDRQARDENGEVDLDFTDPGCAWSKHERRPTGHRFSVEFHDSTGFCFHRVCLTGSSSLEAFADWTRAHQAVTPPAVDPGSTAPEPGPVSRQSILPSDWLLSEPEALARLLDACLEREVAVHAIVGGSCGIQGHRFVPRKRAGDDANLCFHSDEIALHFEPGKFSAVRLHNLNLSGAECWSLKAYDARGTLALTLLPAASERLQIWNLLLRALA